MGDQPVARQLPTHRIQNKRIQTSMPRVGFERTILVFERTKTDLALERAATVMGENCVYTYVYTYQVRHNMPSVCTSV
jgi:hypothetical protein